MCIIVFDVMTSSRFPCGYRKLETGIKLEHEFRYMTQERKFAKRPLITG